MLRLTRQITDDLHSRIRALAADSGLDGIAAFRVTPNSDLLGQVPSNLKSDVALKVQKRVSELKSRVLMGSRRFLRGIANTQPFDENQMQFSIAGSFYSFSPLQFLVFVFLTSLNYKTK